MTTQTKTTWQKMKLADIADVRDGTHDTPKKQISGKPLITSKQLKNGSILSTDYFISEEDFELVNKRSKVDRNDVLISMIGTVGDTVFVKNEPDFAIKNIGLIKNRDFSTGKFIFYWLNSPAGKEEIEKRLRGTSQRFLSLGSLRELEVFMPDLLTQKQIADVLSAYDDLIENNTKRIKILEQIVQAIYREWFVYFRFPGHEKLKMIDSKTEFGKIPEGWEVKKLDERFEVVLGGTPSRANTDYWNGDIPWINSSETNHLRVVSPSELITKKGLENSATKLMPKRTTVLAITGATLGQVSLLEIECSANQSVVGVYDKDALYNEYLYLFISSQIEDIISKSGGSAQQHINKKIVEEYPILLPPEKYIEEFNEIITPSFDLLSDLLFSNQTLRQAQDLLLPKLVGGEIKI